VSGKRALGAFVACSKAGAGQGAPASWVQLQFLGWLGVRGRGSISIQQSHGAALGGGDSLRAEGPLAAGAPASQGPVQSAARG
jgi:hypothetical protein